MSCEDESGAAVPPIFPGTPATHFQPQPPPLLKRIDLPLLSHQRSVLGGGIPMNTAVCDSHHHMQFGGVLHHKPNADSIPPGCKYEPQLYPCMQSFPPMATDSTQNFTLPGMGLNYQQKPLPKTVFHYGPSPSTGLKQQHLQLVHVPMPMQYYRPQSPTFSDVSSIMLTSPRSPAGSSIAAPPFNDPQNLKSFLLSKRNSMLPPLSNPGGSVNVAPESTYHHQTHPSLSPFLSSTTADTASSSIAVPSRKRPHSGSPMSDLSEFGSIIRASPNSVIAFLGQNTSPGLFSLQSTNQPPNTNGMGHLIGQNNIQSPYQYLVKEQETLIEQNQSFTRGNMDMKITNRIRFSERPSAMKSEADLANEVSPEMEYITRSSENGSNYSEEGVVCQWKGCFHHFNTIAELVQHLEKVHIEKGTIENFVCLWHDCPRQLKPFNARYKLIIHMRIHSGEKPNKCPVSFV